MSLKSPQEEAPPRPSGHTRASAVVTQKSLSPYPCLPPAWDPLHCEESRLGSVSSWDGSLCVAFMCWGGRPLTALGPSLPVCQQNAADALPSGHVSFHLSDAQLCSSLPVANKPRGCADRAKCRKMARFGASDHPCLHPACLPWHCWTAVRQSSLGLLSPQPWPTLGFGWGGRLVEASPWAPAHPCVTSVERSDSETTKKA